MSFANPILGPAVRREREWVKKAISKMNRVKTAGPSGFVVEMMVAGETGIDLLVELHSE